MTDNVVSFRPRKQQLQDPATRPLGKLTDCIGGDLRLRCIRCGRAMRSYDITVTLHYTVTIDCPCGERSEIWAPPLDEVVEIQHTIDMF